MIDRVVLAGALVALCSSSLAADSKLDPMKQWGQWRGPLGTGVAPHGDPPREWSEKKNVRWKTALPGRGHSTPVVWGDRIYLTTAVAHGAASTGEFGHAHGAHDNVAPSRQQKFTVLALDRRTGKLLWERTVRTARPHDSTHESGTWASNSAVTDGEHVVVSFGSHGIYGLDTEGKLLWETDLGDMRVKHGHGEGSSPALSGDSVIVNWDHEGDSFVVALDKTTGKERWRAARDEPTSWSTPLVVEHGDRKQVVIAATNRVRGYDLSNGKSIWEARSLSGNVVASPVHEDGFVYAGSSYEIRRMMAVRLDGAAGDVTGTDQVAWTRDRDTPYVPSPVLYDGTLCFLKHYQSLLTCLRAKSGRTLFGPQRLPGIRNVYASPVGAAGRIYIVDLDGTTLVLARGVELEVLATNRLDDVFSASPAIVGDALFLRGERHLYCIAEEPKE